MFSRASGHTVAFSGFTAVYEESTDDEKQGESGKPLPPFAEGDALTALSIEPSQHFTQPPARYTEASLVRAMEERGNRAVRPPMRRPSRPSRAATMSPRKAAACVPPRWARA